MEIEQKKQGGIAIISIRGNLVGSCEADSLHLEFEKLISSGQFRLVLDMSQVNWMGSLCVGAIMRELISVRKKGGDMHLAGLSGKVRRVFQITKLDGIVNIYPTIQAAVEAFKSSP